MDTLELIQLSKNGDKAARDKIVEENLRLVWSIVRRFNAKNCEMEDLFQIGSIGLIKAVNNFDLSYDVKFSTYAVPLIIGEIKRFLRDDGMIKISRSLKETAYHSKTAKEELMLKIQREPTIEELSEYMNIEKCDLIMALNSVADVESIYKTIYQSEGNTIELVDKLEENDNKHDKLIDRLTLEQIIGELDESEQLLIRLRYFEDKTQTQVAEIMGISQVQVSRLEKKILQKLRKKIEK